MGVDELEQRAPLVDHRVQAGERPAGEVERQRCTRELRPLVDDGTGVPVDAHNAGGQAALQALGPVHEAGQ